MYFSSLGMRGKNVVGEGTEKIMPPEAVLTEEPRDPSPSSALGQRVLKVHPAYANGPEVMDRK